MNDLITAMNQSNELFEAHLPVPIAVHRGHHLLQSDLVHVIILPCTNKLHHLTKLYQIDVPVTVGVELPEGALHLLNLSGSEVIPRWQLIRASLLLRWETMIHIY